MVLVKKFTLIHSTPFSMSLGFQFDFYVPDGMIKKPQAYVCISTKPWLALTEAGIFRLLPPPRPPGVQREPSFYRRVSVRVLWCSRSLAFSELFWERGKEHSTVFFSLCAISTLHHLVIFSLHRDVFPGILLCRELCLPSLSPPCWGCVTHILGIG